MRGADDPARLCRTRDRNACSPQQQARDARAARCQREFAAGDEVELFAVAPGFQHDAAQRIAGQRISRGPQCRLDIGRAHGDQQARIEAELTPAAHGQRAAFAFGEILPDPQQRPLCRDTMRKAGDKARGRRAVPAFGEHLMHGATCEPALQRRVRLGMTERHAIRRIGIAVGLDALDAAAQLRERGHACAGHAPLLEIVLPWRVFSEPIAGPFVHDMF